MADNYLEKRMEEYRAGQLSRKVSVTGPARRKDVLQVPFPPRRVLVTGGVNGIGLAVVRAYLRAGCKVAVMDIDEEGGRRLAHDAGIRFYPVDLTDADVVEKSLDNLLAAWMDVDIVVSNAGIADFTPLADGDIEYFDRVLDTNLRPTYIIARRLARHRRHLPYPNPFGGRVMVISSTRHIQSEEGTEAYSASKGGLASLTHALMMSLAEFRITVNSISPGWIHTGDISELTAADHEQHPSRRVGTPEDIARLCIFLSLPGNDFINGADIPVDGGMTHRMIYV